MSKKEDTENETAAKLVGINRDNYVTSRTPAGTKSLNNGDVVAVALGGLTVDELFGVADEVCGENDYREKYAKLNNGMKRMNLGNRIRGEVNKIDKANEKADKPGKSGIERLTKITAPLQKAAQKVADAAAKVKAQEAETKAKAKAKADKEKTDKKAHKAKAAA